MSQSPYQVHDIVSVNGSIGIVRFVGHIEPWKDEIALGIEWDEIGRGKNDGSVAGIHYFSCAPKQGSFVKAKVVPCLSVSEALTVKYTRDIQDFEYQHKFGKKVVEPVGLAKEAARHADVSRLKTASLSGLNIGHLGSTVESCKLILPSLLHLDLSCNRLRPTCMGALFAWISSCVPQLNSLVLNRTNLAGVTHYVSPQTQCPQVSELSVNCTRVDAQDVAALLTVFPNTRQLYISGNSLHRIPLVRDSVQLVDLSHNNIGSVDTDVTRTSLNLSYNGLRAISAQLDCQHLDLSNNNLALAVSELCDRLPCTKLRSLRIANNPMYPRLEETDRPSDPNPELIDLELIARISSLEKLNGSTVTASQRRDAELWFMGQVARRALVCPESSPVWVHLLAVHGPPIASGLASAAEPEPLKKSLVSVDIAGPLDPASVTLKVQCSVPISKLKTMAARRARWPLVSMLDATLVHSVYGVLNDTYTLDHYVNGGESISLELCL